MSFATDSTGNAFFRSPYLSSLSPNILDGSGDVPGDPGQQGGSPRVIREEDDEKCLRVSVLTPTRRRGRRRMRRMRHMRRGRRNDSSSSSSSCRVLRIDIARFQLLKELTSSSGYVTIGARIRGQSDKHILRSDRIAVPDSARSGDSSTTSGAASHGMLIDLLQEARAEASSRDGPDVAASAPANSPHVVPDHVSPRVAESADLNEVKANVIFPEQSSREDVPAAIAEAQDADIVSTSAVLINTSLALVLEFEYLCSLEGPPAIAQILLQKPHKNFRGKFKTMALIEIHIDDLLQKPLERVWLNLYAPLSRLDELVDQFIEPQPHKNMCIARVQVTAETRFRGNEAIASPLSDEVSYVGSDSDSDRDGRSQRRPIHRGSKSAPNSPRALSRRRHSQDIGVNDARRAAEGDKEIRDGERRQIALNLKLRAEKYIADLKSRGQKWIARFRIAHHNDASGALSSSSPSGSEWEGDYFVEPGVGRLLLDYLGVPAVGEQLSRIFVEMDNEDNAHYPKHGARSDRIAVDHIPMRRSRRHSTVHAPRYVLFIDACTHNGQRLHQHIKHRGPLDSTLQNVVVVASSGDMYAAVKLLMHYMKGCQDKASRGEIVRIALAGGDQLVSHFLQAYAGLLSRDRRLSDRVRVFVIPLAQRAHHNQIASFIATHDATYRGLFFSTEWQSCIAQGDWIDAQVNKIASNIMHYLFHAEQVMGLPIGEVLIDLVTSGTSHTSHTSHTSPKAVSATVNIGTDKCQEPATNDAAAQNVPPILSLQKPRTPVLVSRKSPGTVDSRNVAFLHEVRLVDMELTGSVISPSMLMTHARADDTPDEKLHQSPAVVHSIERAIETDADINSASAEASMLASIASTAVDDGGEENAVVASFVRSPPLHPMPKQALVFPPHQILPATGIASVGRRYATRLQLDYWGKRSVKSKVRKHSSKAEFKVFAVRRLVHGFGCGRERARGATDDGGLDSIDGDDGFDRGGGGGGGGSGTCVTAAAAGGGASASVAAGGSGGGGSGSDGDIGGSDGGGAKNDSGRSNKLFPFFDLRRSPIKHMGTPETMYLTTLTAKEHRDNKRRQRKEREKRRKAAHAKSKKHGGSNQRKQSLGKLVAGGGGVGGGGGDNGDDDGEEKEMEEEKGEEERGHRANRKTQNSSESADDDAADVSGDDHGVDDAVLCTEISDERDVGSGFLHTTTSPLQSDPAPFSNRDPSPVFAPITPAHIPALELVLDHSGATSGAFESPRSVRYRIPHEAGTENAASRAAVLSPRITKSGSVTSSRAQLNIEPKFVNKVICSSLEYESFFSVRIDGVLWTRVNFVSISSLWSSRNKILPVASFVRVGPAADINDYSISGSTTAELSGDIGVLSITHHHHHH